MKEEERERGREKGERDDDGREGKWKHYISSTNPLSLPLSGYVFIKDALRSGLHRDLGGIANKGLHLYCRNGTKKLIVDYVKEVCEKLQYIQASFFLSLCSFSSSLLFHFLFSFSSLFSLSRN
jgi:hypothetical protein